MKDPSVLHSMKLQIVGGGGGGGGFTLPYRSRLFA